MEEEDKRQKDELETYKNMIKLYHCLYCLVWQRWRKQERGYRDTGGSPFVTFTQVCAQIHSQDIYAVLPKSSISCWFGETKKHK